MVFKSRPAILISTSLAFMFLLCATPYLSGVSAYSGNLPTLNTSIIQKSCTDCFAGYTINTSATAVGINSVSVMLKVPNVKCSSSSQSSFFGVALLDSSSDIAEAGIVAQCSGTNPIYSALYVATLSNSGKATWTPAPGNVISITASRSSSAIKVTLKDLTTKHTTTASSLVKGVVFTFGGCLTIMPLTPQVNYGRVSFSSCKASVGGKSGPISVFSSYGLTAWTCYNLAMTKILAKPSSISSTGSFTVAYLGSGP
jgi:hypothetical protein